MLIQLREIVEKVASESRLNEALDILVNEICLAMQTEVCSIYLADHEHCCYYLMATKGLKNTPGNTITLAFDEGIIGLVGRLAIPINLANAKSHPSFKYIPSVQEDCYSAFLGIPIINRRHLLGVLVIQQREHRQFSKSEESFLVTLGTQLAALLSHSQICQLFGKFRQTRLKGISAAPGIAIAVGWMYDIQPLLHQVSKASTLDIPSEKDRLLAAIGKVDHEFRLFSKRFANSVQKDSAAIFNLYSLLLTDTRLKKDLFASIDSGYIAEWAVKSVIDNFIFQVATLKDHYLRERAEDLRVLGERLLFHLHDNIAVVSNVWPIRFILVTEELTATILAELPQESLVGIVVRDGTVNSHAAILTRAMGIPTVMGVDIFPLYLDKHFLIVDGYRGEVFIEPENLLIHEYRRLIKEEQELSKIIENSAEQFGQLKSGERIHIMLNAGLSPEHEKIKNNWIDGIGLYRTEIPFMLHNTFPSEEEQIVQYQSMLQLCSNKPVTLRTLDVGSDKQLPYMPIKNEENACLGWRGIRLALDHPEIFLIQIRAMLRANINFGNLNILLPMISNMDEIEEVYYLINRGIHEVEEMMGYSICRPPIGIMIEVPSMLFMISHLEKFIDFISVGTNDLTQYLLAVDRNNRNVTTLYDPLHPAILRALHIIVKEARKAKLKLFLCGEMAGDPMCVGFLVGLGYYNLSMNVKNIPRIKYLLRHLEYDEVIKLSQQGVQARTATEVRNMIFKFLQSKDLESLIGGTL